MDNSTKGQQLITNNLQINRILLIAKYLNFHKNSVPSTEVLHDGYKNHYKQLFTIH